MNNCFSQISIPLRGVNLLYCVSNTRHSSGWASFACHRAGAQSGTVAAPLSWNLNRRVLNKWKNMYSVVLGVAQKHFLSKALFLNLLCINFSPVFVLVSHSFWNCLPLACLVLCSLSLSLWLLPCFHCLFVHTNAVTLQDASFNALALRYSLEWTFLLWNIYNHL